MRKFVVAMFCLLTRTDQFGLYDDSGDVKLVDESAKKLRFFAERVEQHCFGEVPCSRRKFETLIPEIGKWQGECGMNMSRVQSQEDEFRNNIFNFASYNEPAKAK
jgi:hypothetical protein